MRFFNDESKIVRRRAAIAVACTFALAALGDAGCGTWSGNPKNPPSPTSPSTTPAASSLVTLKFRGDTTAALSLSAGIPVTGKNGASLGTLNLSEARVVLSEIKVKTDADDAEQRDEFKGPFIVDLLTNSVSPDPGTIGIAAGAYSRIELKLHALSGDNAGVLSGSDPLRDHSIYLAGNFTDLKGATRPFVFEHDVGEKFSMAAGTPIDIKENITSAVVIAFQLGTWFNLTGAEADFNDISGPIELTKDGVDAAKKIRDHLKENIKGSGHAEKEGDESTSKGSTPELPN